MSSWRAWRWAQVLTLLFLVGLAPVSANNADNDAEVNLYAAESDLGPLQAWADMAAGIRVAATAGEMTFFAEGGSFDIQGAITFLIPSMVIVGISLVLAFGALIACPCYFCCRGCGNCGGNQPDPNGYTPNERYVALGVLILGFLFIFIGFLIGLVGNQKLGGGVAGTTVAVQSTLSDVQALPDNVDEVLVNVTLLVPELVNSIVGLLDPTDLLQQFGISGFKDNITDSLRNISALIKELNSTVLYVDELVTQLEDNITLLATQVNPQYARLEHLQNSTFSSNGHDSNLNTTCISAYDEVPNISGFIPSFASVVASVFTIDLDGIIDQIDDAFDSLGGTLQDTIDQFLLPAIDGVLGQMDTFINFGNSTIQQAVTPALGVLAPMEEQITDIVETYVAPYENIRFIVMACLFAVLCVIILLAMGALLIHAHWLITFAVLLSFFCLFVFWLMCGLHYILAAPLGKVCGVLDTAKTEGAASITASIPNLPFQLGEEQLAYADLGIQLLETCGSENSSLLDAISGIEIPGLGNDTDLAQFLDITNLIDTFLGDYDFASLLDSFDTDALISQIADLTSLDLGTFLPYLSILDEDFGLYIKIIKFAVVRQAETQVQFKIAEIDFLLSSSAALQSCLIYSPASPNMAAETSHEAYYQPELTSIRAELAGIDFEPPIAVLDELNITLIEFSARATESLPTLEALLETYEGLEDEVRQLVNATKTQVLSDTIPTILNEIYSFANTLEAMIDNLVDCAFVANDYQALENSVCVLFVRGLDVLWWTCGMIGVFLIMVIVGLTMVGKRFILADQSKENFYDDGEYELSDYGAQKA
eukprot:NODE_54_length_2750_cov_59.870759_g35_i0.p1 GENE.NODE_54_length_2750_cov_59.870759_g35_i0~~NODE_54_length_2750_cov_59.870759_g35_i0.p1  ORF type:complete len:823 (+),score=181.41 NODE_54_length_2750_cov_59.870759_g35_i0:153-2621(+)